MDAEFIVVSGAHLGARFPLAEREVSIGRAAAAGIRLSEPGVAPEHCVVRPSPAGHRLTDRRSSSGTYINGMRVTEQALEPGAKLPEDSIGERFGASRTIVRHALGQLAAEGSAPMAIMV